MKTPKIESKKSANNSEKADDIDVDNSEKKGAGRRLQDAITSDNLNRKLNLDRRIVNNDRRANTDPNYKGTARRNTIDRRMDLKDRREKG